MTVQDWEIIAGGLVSAVLTLGPWMFMVHAKLAVIASRIGALGEIVQHERNGLHFEAGNSDNLAALLGANVAYNSSTHQFTGVTMTGNATITPTQGAALLALINTSLADLVSAKGDTAATKADAATAATDASAASVDAATTSTNAAAAHTAANALSTAAIATDLTAAQAIISSANVYIQTDTSVVTDVALLNGGLVAALTFVRDTSILAT